MVKSEYRQWADELNPPVKLSIPERIAARWGAKKPPEPPMFAWLETSELPTHRGDTDV